MDLEEENVDDEEVAVAVEDDIDVESSQNLGKLCFCLAFTLNTCRLSR